MWFSFKWCLPVFTMRKAALKTVFFHGIKVTFDYFWNFFTTTLPAKAEYCSKATATIFYSSNMSTGRFPIPCLLLLFVKYLLNVSMGMSSCLSAFWIDMPFFTIWSASCNDASLYLMSFFRGQFRGSFLKISMKISYIKLHITWKLQLSE